jgi:hypothetical protein
MKFGKVRITCAGFGADMYIEVNSVKVAKRGRPGTPDAKTWVTLVPGWSVVDINFPYRIEIKHEGGERALVLIDDDDDAETIRWGNA